jgi:hypothetical protein
VAGCQVAPASVETSTAATRPPPASVAVPVTVTLEPLPTLLPSVGDVKVVSGAVVSEEAVVAVRPAMSVVGWAPMSASRLTVACCMRESAGDCVPSCCASRPHAHWMVPAPKTRAPLAAR